MTKKVFELAKEMGIASKDLLAKANGMGIELKSHMSVLSDADIEKIKGGPKKEAKPGAPGRKPPIGKPIVDENFLANKHKPPVGKPIVDESFLANKDKKEEDPKTPAKAKTESKAAGTKETAKAKVEAKIEGAKDTVKAAVASKAGKAEDKKPETKKAETKKPEEKPIRTIKTIEPLRRPSVKIIKRASEEDHKKSEAAKAANAGKPSGDRKSSGDRRPSGDRRTDGRSGGRNDNRNGNSGDRNGSRGNDSRRRPSEGGNRSDNRNGGGRNDNRNGGGRSDNRNGGGRTDNRNGNGGNRNNRNEGSNRPASEGGDSRGNRATRRGNNNNNNGGHNGRRDNRGKFSRFEKKSLEKKERKKYTSKQKEVEEEVEEEVLPEGTFKVNVPITVAGLCEQTEVSTSRVIMTLMKMGIMANINQNIDEDILLILADELGIKVVVGTIEKEEVEEGIEDYTDREKDLKDRPPIITVMGHVDHGKTSLLDAIRSTNVTASESGGITQHIGASEVSINGHKIVFLDTPGHEAFTAMRARGAHITDIAVLVVAADDSVKPQTIESISHAKAAGVPIIVAINKMDKPGANPDKVKKDLADNGVLVEDWGGEVIGVPVSAKTGEGIKDLLEMIILQSEVLELKANPNRLAMGSVIEARLDKSKGPVATLLVLNGTLQAGQSVVAGTSSGRIRLMTDYKGKTIKKAGPATAVEILGLTDVPEAGDDFNAVKDDKTAREIAEHRQEKLREEVMARNSSTTLEKLFSQIQEGETKELNLIIKADVQGSVGATISSLEKLNNENVKVNVIHSGVGTVTESDVMLAETSDAVIIGFNVRPSTAVSNMADQSGVEIRLYRVIYDVINDVEAAMKGMLDPEFKEEVLGKAEIRETFKVPGVGVIGGGYITDGKVVRNAEIRLVRDGIVIHEGKISSLKRFKDDAKEVAQGYECGIGIEDYNDIKEGDVIECFTMVEIKAQ